MVLNLPAAGSNEYLLCDDPGYVRRYYLCSSNVVQQEKYLLYDVTGFTQKWHSIPCAHDRFAGSLKIGAEPSPADPPPHTTMFDLVATEDDQRASAPPHRVRFVSETHRARYTGVEVPRPRARRALARTCPRASVHQARVRRARDAFSGGHVSHGRL